MPTLSCNCNCQGPQDSPRVEQTSDIGTYTSPAPSCQEIARSKAHQLPSYQWIKNSTCDPVMVFCSVATQCCSQGDVGWMRVANFDMSDSNQNCPQGFSQRSSPIRACGRTLRSGGCQSMYFSAGGVKYSKICGQVIGYQFGTPSAFSGGSTNIDGAYVDGVSITHGSSPRKHIWTFANDLFERDDDSGLNVYLCPCTSQHSPMRIPSFVGNDYFCDTGASTTWSFTLFPGDPLWNGNGCEHHNTCCTFNKPPWFCKELPASTTDDIEVRICADQSPPDEDSLIHKIELYVK